MSEKFLSRGLGLDGLLHDFVTGEPGEKPVIDNIAAFVDSKEAGLRAVAMFNGLARLDFRPSEPHWIQVKVGVNAENLPALVRLDQLVKANGGVLDPGVIAVARQAAPSYTFARERFNSRGLGYDRIAHDFVTGEELGLIMPNICAFVDAGAQENLKKIFGGCVHFRENKAYIGTSEANRPALMELDRLTRESGGLITQEMVAQARGAMPANRFQALAA